MSDRFGSLPPLSQFRPGAFAGADISSFTDYVRTHAPDQLPSARAERLAMTAIDPSEIPHGTTIVAVSYPGGVILAGDRRATMGNLIATRDVKKVYITDEYSAAGIAGTAGIAIEMVRLFAVELEHYEKIERELPEIPHRPDSDGKTYERPDREEFRYVPDVAAKLEDSSKKKGKKKSKKKDKKK